MATPPADPQTHAYLLVALMKADSFDRYTFMLDQFLKSTDDAMGIFVRTMIGTIGLAPLILWTKRAYIEDSAQLMDVYVRAWSRMFRLQLITRETVTPEARAVIKVYMNNCKSPETAAMAKALYDAFGEPIPKSIQPPSSLSACAAKP